MSDAAKYRRKTGLLDADGKVHFIKGYAALPVGDADIAMRANYMFGAIGIGLQLPESAIEASDAGKIWDVPSQRSNIVGGHYVVGTGMNSKGKIVIVTWGGVQGVTPEFIDRYMDEGLVYFSEEYLMGDTTPENFDSAALDKAIASLNGSAA
jgi:hypothetical protein